MDMTSRLPRVLFAGLAIWVARPIYGQGSTLDGHRLEHLERRGSSQLPPLPPGITPPARAPGMVPYPTPPGAPVPLGPSPIGSPAPAVPGTPGAAAADS